LSASTRKFSQHFLATPSKTQNYWNCSDCLCSRDARAPIGSGRQAATGRYFVQNHLYWAYLILILTGMRPGEVGQIKCVDIQTDGEYYYFDLRPFDARKGRVAIEDLRNLKTNSSGRVVPIHPLLIELGLLDRLLYLINAGEERLFPEWKEFASGDGTTRWSQPIT
jgi:integrase